MPIPSFVTLLCAVACVGLAAGQNTAIEVTGDGTMVVAHDVVVNGSSFGAEVREQADLAARLATLEDATTNSLSPTVSALETANANLEATVSTLQTANANLQATVSTLTSKVDGLPTSEWVQMDIDGTDAFNPECIYRAWPNTGSRVWSSTMVSLTEFCTVGSGSIMCVQASRKRALYLRTWNNMNSGYVSDSDAHYRIDELC